MSGGTTFGLIASPAGWALVKEQSAILGQTGQFDLVQIHWETYGYLAFKMHCNQEVLFRVAKELGSRYYMRVS